MNAEQSIGLTSFVRDVRQGPRRLGWAEIPSQLRSGIKWTPLIFILFGVALLIPGAQLTINDRPVTRDEFIAHMWVWIPLLVALWAVSSYAIWTERRWMRELSVVVVLAGALSRVWYSDFDLPLLGWAALVFSGGADIWFWYYKRDISAYYQRLKELGA